MADCYLALDRHYEQFDAYCASAEIIRMRCKVTSEDQAPACANSRFKHATRNRKRGSTSTQTRSLKMALVPTSQQPYSRMHKRKGKRHNPYYSGLPAGLQPPQLLLKVSPNAWILQEAPAGAPRFRASAAELRGDGPWFLLAL